MSKQSTPLLTLTMTASGAVAAHRFVKQTGAQTGAGENAIGVSRTAAADTAKFPVDVLGTTVVEAGDVIALTDTIKADADGKAIPWASSGAKLAIPLQAATAAGQFIEVLLVPNVA